MKKQKAQSTNDVKHNIESDLGILIFDNSTDASFIDKVIDKLQNSRNEPNLFVVSESKSSQKLNELLDKGKAFIGSRSEIRNTIENSTSQWIAVADADNIDSLQSLISFYSSNKKQLAHESVYTAVIDKSSGKSSKNLWDKVKLTLFNTVAQSLTPTPEPDLTFPFKIFHKSVISGCIEGSADNAATFSSNASYLQYSFNTIPVTTKEIQSQRINYSYIWKNAFRSRINWFVKDAMKAGEWWRPAYFALVLISLVGMLIMSQQFGMTWDEKRHNDYSKESLKYFESFGEDTTCLSENLPTQEFRYYGEHFNVIAAFLYSNILPFGEFETRHLLNALYGFLTILFASLLAKEIGSWRMAFVAFLLILTSPVFFGHSMNNPTDIPFALGFAMAMYYLIKVFKTLPAPKTSYIIMAGVGVGIAVGSRVGGVLLYAYAGLYLGIDFLLNYKQNKFKQIPAYIKILLTLFISGHFISVLLWPFGQQHIFTSWYEALKKSTEGAYFTYNHELFEGVRMYMANVPWYYLPKFIIMNTPLGVLAGFVISILGIVFWKKVFEKNWIVVSLVLFGLIFPIVYAEYQSMYYYNGWRHYLFIYPPLIILSSAGWELIMRLIGKPSISGVVLYISIATCLLPAFWMVKNHPNEVVYFNELAGGVQGAYGNYETDYYSNSCRQAGEWLAQHEPNAKVLVAINNEPMTAAYYAQKINPNMEFRWVREYEEQKPFWNYAIFTSRTYSQKELKDGAFPPKGTIYTVEADGVPLAAVVKREDWNMPLGYQALNNKNNDSAVYYFTMATKYNPKDEETWRMLGEAYMNKMSADTALIMLNKSIEISPENYSAYNDIGQVYMNIKRDYSQAIKNFEKSTSLKFNYAEGYYYEANCYMAMQDYNKAISLMETAIKRGGNGIPELYYNLGVCYLYTGLYKKAEDNFISCLTLSPNLAMGYRALAEAFSKQGKNNEAQQCMAKYQQLGGR